MTSSSGWTGTATLTVSLYDVDPYSPAAIPLASATGSFTNGSGAWVDVYWPAVAVTPGQTYWVDWVDTGAVSICFQGHLGFDAYTGGEFYYQGAPFFLPGWDLTFRTWADGGGGLTLASSGSCPGAMTLSVSGAGAGNGVALVYGAAGSFTIPGGSCAGLALDVTSPTLGAVLTADAAGDASATPTIPGGACGMTVQAVDLGTCTVSNTIVL